MEANVMALKARKRKPLTPEQKKAKKIYNKKYYAEVYKFIKKPLTAEQKERKRIYAKEYYEKPENKARILARANARAKERYLNRKLACLQQNNL